MNSTKKNSFYVCDVQVDRVWIRSLDSNSCEFDKSFDVFPSWRADGLWYIPCATADYPFPELLMKLRDKGLPFLNAGPGWHPGGIFEHLRENGKVTGNYSTIIFRGDGGFEIEEGK